AFVTGRHVVDDLGGDAEVVRPEPHQPFGKADVGLERGVVPRLDLLEEVFSLAVGRALRSERGVGGLGGARLARLLGHARSLLLGETLVLFLGALREDCLRAPLGARLESGARRRAGADEFRVVDAAGTRAFDLGDERATRIGGDLGDRVSLRSETESMQRQRRLALALVACFYFLRHGNRPLILSESRDQITPGLELNGRAGEVLADRLEP